MTGMLLNDDCSTGTPPTPYPDPCGGDGEPACENCFCPEEVECTGFDNFFTKCWTPDAGGGTICPD